MSKRKSGIEYKLPLKNQTPSKSKILRECLWRLWNQTENEFDDSEKFYEHKMDEIINHFKNKLNN